VSNAAKNSALLAQGITQAALAGKMGWTKARPNELIKGKRGITAAAFDLFQHSYNLGFLESCFAHFPFSFSASLCRRTLELRGAILREAYTPIGALTTRNDGTEFWFSKFQRELSNRWASRITRKSRKARTFGVVPRWLGNTAWNSIDGAVQSSKTRTSRL